MWLPDGRVHKLRRSSADPGCAHAFTFSCNQKLPLLNDDATRELVLRALDGSRKRLDLALWAYVIMPDHVHVLLLPRGQTYEVAAILRAMKQPVAQAAIRQLRERDLSLVDRLLVKWPTGRAEYRFWQQGGGYDRNIVNASTAWACLHYIHNNPIRRGLVECATDWPWSSARQYAGLDGVKLAMDGFPPDPEL